MIGEEVTYGASRRTPYAFVFVGNRGYPGLKGLLSEPGTDGTVRWAGCPLNTRKFVLDLTRDPARPTAEDRAGAAPCCNVDVPLHFVDGLDHSTILSKPSDELVELVASALRVASAESYQAWLRAAHARSSAARAKAGAWQQFVLRAVDERGDPIPDYHVQLLTGDGDRIGPFHTDVHAYATDKSYRAFHVDLDRLGTRPKRMKLRVLASSGTRYVGYTGVGSEKLPVEGGPPNAEGKWDAQIDLSAIIGDERLRFFFPFTTTLIELKLDREPLPLAGENRLMWFLPKGS
jgi:hypothetical protein